jgi:phosphate transport system permease protein
VAVEVETTVVEARPAGDEVARDVQSRPDAGDRVFLGVTTSAGLFVLAITGAVGLFLFFQALKALRAVGVFSFLTTAAWQPDALNFGVAAVIAGTVTIAVVAIAISTPIATGTALFIAEIAPGPLKRALVGIVDLMAAVPSVVFGLWGFAYLQVNALGLARWISTWLGWIPIFQVSGADPSDPLSTNSVYASSAFIAGIVVGLMIAPIQCSIMRDVFSQAPPGEREGAFALGATRWGMIRAVVLPFGTGGMIGGTMLALGRALGETIAVYLIISPDFDLKFHPLEKGANSVSALIATRYGDASELGLSALFAAGLVLFVFTLVVNFTASTIVARSRSGAMSDG